MTLTPDEILALEAGASTDAIVADALGWKWMSRIGEPAAKWCFRPSAEKHFDGRCHELDGIVGEFEPCEKPNHVFPRLYPQLPAFSIDIAAAWTLVDAMNADGWWWEITSSSEKHQAYLNRVGEFRALNHTHADTMPLAISRAFLMSKLRGGAMPQNAKG